MENQLGMITDEQRAFCAENNIGLKPLKSGDIEVTDRDPYLVSRKMRLPKHKGLDVQALINKVREMQVARAAATAPIPEPVVETVVEAETTVETEDEVIDAEAELEDLVIDPDAVEDVPEVTNVVPLRRAALTPEEMMAPKVTLSNVVLDNSGKKTKTVKPERKHRDNRLARAFRAIIENPEATIVEQAAIADVTVAMLGYYEIQLRSVYKIIAEKFGADVIPTLPVLNK